MRGESSSGLPVIVLAPVEAADCYQLTAHTLNLVEQYRCPVFVASNKEIAMIRESVGLAGIDLPLIAFRRLANRTQPFLPFAAESDDGVPDFLPIGDSNPVRQTSSTHDINGYITVDPDEINAFQLFLEKKLIDHVNALTLYDQDLDLRAGTLLLVYGVTARAARMAARRRGFGRQAKGARKCFFWAAPVRVSLLPVNFFTLRE
jgi:2-oxoglutarate ferredoxin oxidoreductase subunit alpha